MRQYKYKYRIVEKLTEDGEANQITYFGEVCMEDPATSKTFAWEKICYSSTIEGVKKGIDLYHERVNHFKIVEEDYTPNKVEE